MQNSHQTYQELLRSLRLILHPRFTQKPQLGSSHHIVRLVYLRRVVSLNLLTPWLLLGHKFAICFLIPPFEAAFLCKTLLLVITRDFAAILALPHDILVFCNQYLAPYPLTCCSYR